MLVGFERLQVEFGAFDLRERRLEIKQVQLDAPHLNIHRNADGQLDLLALVADHLDDGARAGHEPRAALFEQG